MAGRSVRTFHWPFDFSLILNFTQKWIILMVPVKSKTKFQRLWKYLLLWPISFSATNPSGSSNKQMTLELLQITLPYIKSSHPISEFWAVDLVDRIHQRYPPFKAVPAVYCTAQYQPLRARWLASVQFHPTSTSLPFTPVKAEKFRCPIICFLAFFSFL